MEKRLAILVIVLVACLLVLGNAYVIHLGNTSWPGETAERWTGSAPQPGR